MKEEEIIETCYTVGEFFLGKKFLQGNSDKEFIRDTFRLGIFMFLPFVLIGCSLVVEALIKLLIGG